MLCASVSCWARLFLQRLRHRSLWIIHKTDGSPASREIYQNVPWLWGLSFWPATATQLSTFSSIYAHCVCRCPDACRLFRTLGYQQPVDAVLRPAFIQKLCYKLPSVVTFTFVQIFDQNFVFFTEWRQSWRLCLIQRQNSLRVIFDVQFERRKVDKKQTYMKHETCKLYSGVFWIFLPNIIKIDPYNF